MWQPIETAPKDGTVVLIFQQDRSNFGGRGIAAGRFMEPPWDGWWGTCGDSIICMRPTHWQPLPEPPS